LLSKSGDKEVRELARLLVDVYIDSTIIRHFCLCIEAILAELYLALAITIRGRCFVVQMFKSANSVLVKRHLCLWCKLTSKLLHGSSSEITSNQAAELSTAVFQWAYHRRNAQQSQPLLAQ
jgi:hypothetical protein